jgi:putative molybdopterin biosynthesis protein
MKLMDTRETSRYLNINEKKLYSMANAGKIPATKLTGKWLFPKELIDAWLSGDAGLNIRRDESPSRQFLFASSHDLALELLIGALRNDGVSITLETRGSLSGLIAIKSGAADAAGIHLLDSRSGVYNTTFIEEYLPNVTVTLLRFVSRSQGFILRKGNPLKIKTLEHLVKSGIRFINRQPGSGTRILLDHLLRKEGLDSARISGYKDEVATHTETSLAVASGSADVGLGILSAARSLNLDFVPLALEEFDLVFASSKGAEELVAKARKIISDAEFKRRVSELGGYDLTRAGTIIRYEAKGE